MQHGKDVYVEKPVSHNVSEGRRAVEVARKYQRICQTGTQSRSTAGMRAAMKYLHDGKLGPLTLARGLCYKRRGSIGPAGSYEPPSHVDYNQWCGPAPLAPLTRRQLHYDWHWMWDYGNGDLGNQGIHQMDLARWGLGLTTLSNAVLSYGGRLGYQDAGETANTQVVVHDYGDKTLVFEVRGLETQPYKGAGVGVIFEGAEGYVVMTSYESGAAFDRSQKLIESFRGGGDHFDNFLKAVRSRKPADLHADILEGHLSSALCHLGNISYRLGEELPVAEIEGRLSSLKSQDNTLETFERTRQHLASNNVDLKTARLRLGPRLAFDAVSEKFTDSPDGNAQLTRDYRDPFIVPSADKI
jgi:predicted dehydrogenase